MPERNYWTRMRVSGVSRRDLLRGAALGGAGLAGAALIGCGGGGASTATPSAAGKTTAPGGAPAAVAAKPGGRLNLTQAGEPPSFDQHLESTTYTNFVTSPSYNQLIKMDPADALEKPTSILPDLASSWEISPDGATYTFKLVQNAKYHDGTPFTSADVKASYERQQKPPKSLATAPRGDQLKPIASMETPDKYTLVLKMGRPVSALSMLPILAQGWMAIYSEKDIVADFDFKKKVNGTGPFIQKSYERGNKVVFDKNKDYFVKDRPYLDGISVYIVPDASTSLANFQSGQLDFRGLSVTEYASMQKALGDKIDVQTVPGYGYEVINFNSQKKPWSDPRVRRAIAMSVNRDDYIKVIGQGEGRPGGYHVDGGYWAISADELLKIPGYEKFNASTLTEARKLLDAAGVPNNSGSEVDLLTRAGSSYEPLSIFIVDQLQKVGIKSKVNIQETATAYDRLRTRDFDLCPWSHGFALDDPDALWAEFYVTGAPRNYSELSTKAIDDLFLKQSMEQDQKKRLELVKELQRISIPEYGKVVMAHTQGRNAQWKRVKDHVVHSSSYNNRRWQQVWLDT